MATNKYIYLIKNDITGEFDPVGYDSFNKATLILIQKYTMNNQTQPSSYFRTVLDDVYDATVYGKIPGFGRIVRVLVEYSSVEDEDCETI
jgi:hypothetical protein